MKTVDEIFPIKLYARDWPNYTQSPHHYRATFLKVKPKGASWFAYHVVILSRTQVEFIVHNIRDSCSGGIGEEIFRCKTEVPASLTEKDVERAILAAAQDRREQEIEAAENAIIAKYAAEIRARIDA